MREIGQSRNSRIVGEGQTSITAILSRRALRFPHKCAHCLTHCVRTHTYRHSSCYLNEDISCHKLKQYYSYKAMLLHMLIANTNQRRYGHPNMPLQIFEASKAGHILEDFKPDLHPPTIFYR